MMPTLWFSLATVNLFVGNLLFGAACSLAGLAAVVFDGDDE